MTAGAELDWSKVERGVRQLTDGIESGARTGAESQASSTATVVRRNVPVRTGALRDSVAVIADGAGYAVTYGTGLRYAGPIEARFHPVADALDGVEQSFATAMESMAGREVGRL